VKQEDESAGLLFNWMRSPLFVVYSIKGRRKDKDPSPCVIAGLHDDECSYLDDELTQESIVDVDLSELVFRPVGVEQNEWLATHSKYSCTYYSLCDAFIIIIITIITTIIKL